MYDQTKRKPGPRTPASSSSLDGITRAIGAAATAGADAPYPHRDAIQTAFGRHDLGSLRAATGSGAAVAAEAIGADAYALGDRVAFRSAPSLHTAAHEAAHVAVGRRGGVVGRAGDADERHADAVADAVVRGESAEPLLDGAGAGGGRGDALQRTQIGNYDTRNLHQRQGIETYLSNPNRTYNELLQIHALVVSEKHDNWEYWKDFIETQMHRWQVNDVRQQNDQRNWGSGMMTVDNRVLHLDQQPVRSGQQQTGFSMPSRMMQTDDIEVSHKDSEVAILQKMLNALGPVLTQNPPSQITIQLISTNGACDACKDRLLHFVDKVKDVLREKGWSYNLDITIRYRYLKPPRHATRHLGGRQHQGGTPVHTMYGHQHDMQTETPAFGETYEHVETHSFDPVEEGTLIEMQEVTGHYQVDQLTQMLQGFHF